MSSSHEISIKKEKSSNEDEITIVVSVSRNGSGTSVSSSSNTSKPSSTTGTTKKIVKAKTKTETVSKICASSTTGPKSQVFASRFPVKEYGAKPKTNIETLDSTRGISKITTNKSRITTKKVATKKSSETSNPSTQVTSHLSKKHTCAICLSCETEEPMATRCGHIFCKKCILKALEKSKYCPMCQEIISAISLIRVYLN